MAYRCQQYNLFTRLLSVLQWHSPQTRSFSSPVIAFTFLYGSLVWNMFPQFASSTTSWEGHLGGAAAGIAAAILFRHKGPQQPELFIDEEEEDNRSYPEDEEVITNPDQEKKE